MWCGAAKDAANREDLSHERPMTSPETRNFELFPRAEIEQTIPSCFERRARLHAQRLAVKTATHQWTYDHLNREANRIAHAILARDQTGRTPVVVLLEQGALPIAALLGVWKAGKIAVPLDPSTPLSRLSQLAAEASPTCVITTSNTETPRTGSSRTREWSSAWTPSTETCRSTAPRWTARRKIRR